MKPSDLALRTPFSLFVSGPSQSGKTIFTQRILNHAEVFSKPIRNVVYAYSQWQPASQEIRDNDSSVVFHEGLPTKDDLSAWSEKEGGLLLVLDAISHTELSVLAAEC